MEHIKKTLKSKTVGGKKYNTIQYDNKGDMISSDYHIVFNVDDAFMAEISHIGSTARKLFVDPIEALKPSVFRLMGYIKTPMSPIHIAVFEDNDGRMLDYRVLADHSFFIYVQQFKRTHMHHIIEEGSSFDHLDHPVFLKINSSVYSPVHANDTGCVVNGDPILFNQSYDLDIGALNHLADAPYSVQDAHFDIVSATLTLYNIPSFFEAAGHITFKKRNGRTMTVTENRYIESVIKTTDVLPFDAHIHNELIDNIHYVANNINNRVTSKKEMHPHYSYQDIADKQYERTYKYHIEEVIDDVINNDAHKQLIHINYIQYLIDQDVLVSAKPVDHRVDATC